jgi:hypothetical protein
MADESVQKSAQELSGIQVIAADSRNRLEQALINESERDEKTRALFEDVCCPIDDCAIAHLSTELRQCRYYFQVCRTANHTRGIPNAVDPFRYTQVLQFEARIPQSLIQLRVDKHRLCPSIWREMRPGEA